jgi:hypothetical protein
MLDIWKANPFATVFTVEHASDHALAAGGETWDFEDGISVSIYRA